MMLIDFFCIVGMLGYIELKDISLFILKLKVVITLSLAGVSLVPFDYNTK